MKRFIVFFISILLIAIMTSSIFCSKYDPTNTSPDSVWVYNGQKVSEDSFWSAVTQDLLNSSPGTVLGGAPSQNNNSSATTNVSSSSKQSSIPKETVIAYFTDLHGHVLGSSCITKGTNIASSQFVQEVPDCEGMSFDHWDYSNMPLKHDIVIRAIYK